MLATVCSASLRLVGFATVAFSLVCIALAGTSQLQYDNAWYNTGIQAIFLGSGILLASYLHGKDIDLSRPVRFGLAIASFAVLWAGCAYLDEPFTKASASVLILLTRYIVTALGCSGVFLSLYGCKKPFPQPLIFLGKISFGLYVFHTFSNYVFEIASYHTHVNIHLANIASFALTFGLAALSYRYLEMPFLRLKERFTFVKSREISPIFNTSTGTPTVAS